MKNLKAKAVCVMLSASMAAMGLTGCGSDNVDGTKTAITVNDESITLGQANFMLRYQQATMYNYYSKMYSMYGMQMPSEMYDKEGDDGKTTGETFKEQSLDTIEKELLMRQHAEEYGISLTDEEKQQAKEAAQAFADKNGDDVMKKLHATVEDIQDALELYVIQTKIYDPIIADVDTEVSDEEAKQTSISYITVSTAGTEKDDDGKKIDLTTTDGIDVAALKEIKEVNRARLTEYKKYRPNSEYHEGRGVWVVKADLALPCATQNELLLEDAKALVENGCTAVCEGANMPTTLEATKYLQEHGVIFAPGKAANAGGVATSALEMSQNSERLSWTFEEVDAKLKSIMINITHNMVDAAKRYGHEGDYVMGANIAGFEKVADAMMAQGIC